jgi:acetyltransferase-like isoleucine patch superfamily enzyme
MKFTKHLLPRHDIGDFTYGQPHVIDFNDGLQLHIGKFCSLATHILIILGGMHAYKFLSQYPLHVFLKNEPHKDLEFNKGDIYIGNDVWIATGATILSGVTIGDGAVIGARSVVAKDIPAYSVAVGNPARVIKKRFDDDTIEKLLEIKWWDWPVQKIKDNIDILCSYDIDKLYDISKV